jgi:threonine dehydratase
MADAASDGIRAGVDAAEGRIRPHVRETPLEPSPFLGELAGREVYLKMENLQHTGSFKVRGALNKLLSLSPGERGRGIVAASSGNHGAAVAFGARKLGLGCRVFVPEGASSTKVRAMERLGAEVRFHSTDTALAEARARQDAAERGAVYVSPYNDPDVIYGQGTISAEILRQLDKPDEVFVPVGGGGLVSGVAGYLKSLFGDGVRVVGCQPENSAVMAHSVEAGRILEMESAPTLSDGTAGGVESGAVTFELCRAFVDEWVLVSEEEISAAMRLVMETHHTMIEGAAATGVAALIKSTKRSPGNKAVVVLCGANIALDTLGKVLERVPGR